MNLMKLAVNDHNQSIFLKLKFKGILYTAYFYHGPNQNDASILRYAEFYEYV